MDYMETPAERVRRARQTRGWSIRTASARGGISNETWGKFERGDADVTDAVRRGVSAAFGWPGNWEGQDVEPVVEPLSITEQISALATAVEELRRVADVQLRMTKAMMAERHVSTSADATDQGLPPAVASRRFRATEE